MWQSISRNAAPFVTLLYIGVVGSLLAVISSHFPSFTTASGKRIDDAALREASIQAEKLGMEGYLLLLPWIVLEPRNAGMLVLVAALNVGTVYVLAVLMFGRPRKWRARYSLRQEVSGISDPARPDNPCS
jgi:hypothetical protein